MPTKLSKNPEVRARQRQKIRERAKERRRTDPEYRAKMNFKKKERIRVRKAEDPTFRLQFNRRKSLRHNFDISLEDYALLLEAQDGKCGICGLEPEPDAVLHVDHNHVTDYIRGLLCFHCNVGIGHFKEDIRLLQRAFDYMRERGE